MQRWEAFRPQFQMFGVTMVTVSPDTVDEIARMRRKYGLGMTMLSDDSLAVCDLYNVRHDKAFAAARAPIRPLAIPTAFLVDGEGIVRWIDQAEDYRVRSDADRILAAVHRVLD